MILIMISLFMQFNNIYFWIIFGILYLVSFAYDMFYFKFNIEKALSFSLRIIIFAPAFILVLWWDILKIILSVTYDFIKNVFFKSEYDSIYKTYIKTLQISVINRYVKLHMRKRFYQAMYFMSMYTDVDFLNYFSRKELLRIFDCLNYIYLNFGLFDIPRFAKDIVEESRKNEDVIPFITEIEKNDSCQKYLLSR